MDIQSLRNRVVMEWLNQFFNNHGLKASIYDTNGEDVLEVRDERDCRWFIKYTLKVIEDGKKVLFDTVSMTTPKVDLTSVDGTLQIRFKSDDESERFTAIFNNARTLVQTIDNFLMEMLLEEPSLFFFYVYLVDKEELDGRFVDKVADEIYQYKISLSCEQRKGIEEDLGKLSQ
jgi:uncharacterized protein YkuJ